MTLPPLIVTLKLDDESFGFFDRLRRRHFPPERNFLSAHLTLFYHLPGENLEAIRFGLIEFCKNQKTFPLEFTGWRFLGKGVAVKIDSIELIALRANLADIWTNWLTAQDRQKFQPHITVQNKVAPDEAKKLYEELARDWETFSGKAQGLHLWHYLGSNWKLEEEFLFVKQTFSNQIGQ